jgi:hypothetical protein
MLQEKSKQVAKKHGLTDFKGSNGWLEKFQKRNNITFKSVCGEATSVDKEAVNNWKAKIPDINSNYAECDIFNADETGLFFRILPTR